MGGPRKLLVIADDSAEWRAALLYASHRAHNSGAGVVVLHALEPARFEHWSGVREEMRRQAHEEAQNRLKPLLIEARAIGVEPELVVVEGGLRTELSALIARDPTIKVVVLAADVGPRGPGPMVAAMAKGRLLPGLKLSVVVIPGDLSADEIAALA